jgi:hypothetical protein
MVGACGTLMAGIGGRAERGASSATTRRGDPGLGGGEGEWKSGRRRLDDAAAVATGAGRGEVGLRG